MNQSQRTIDAASAHTDMTRAHAAFQLSFIGDALAMPVHWFYNPQDIYRAFPGGITRFEPAPDFHPSSIMNLHSVNAGGRARSATAENNAVEIVGDVILRDKRKYWGVANQHYHRGMAAGENTLNLHCLRLVMRSIAHNGGRYSATLFLRDYIEFMTAETPRHPDTYAESYHRGFFANLAKGVAPEKCAAKTHDTASVGGLVTIAPIAITELLFDRSLEPVQTLCRTHLMLTHPDDHLGDICDAYVALIHALLFRDAQDPRDLIAATAKASARIDVAELARKSVSDNDVVGKRFSSACYIDDAWPSLLYLSWKYFNDPQQALTANANLGGDNCHRGAIIGIILGLATGNGLDDLFNQLTGAKEVRNQVAELFSSRE